MEMTKHLVSYDIIEDKRRNKVSKLLKDYGIRVQYSVFEIFVDQKKLVTIANRLEKLLTLRQIQLEFIKFMKTLDRPTLLLVKTILFTQQMF